MPDAEAESTVAVEPEAAAGPEAAAEAEIIADPVAEVAAPADDPSVHEQPVESSNLPVSSLEEATGAEAPTATHHDVVEAAADPVSEAGSEPVSASAGDEAHEVVPEAVVHEAAAEPHHVPVEAEAAAPVEASAEGTGEPVPEPAAETPEPTESSDGIDPAIVAAGAAVAGAVAGAAAVGSRPIWSDQGDAPFDDGEPVRPITDSGRGRQRESGSKRERESGGFFAELFDIVRTVIYALLIAMVVRVFFFQPFTIPSASMEPNLYEGDYIVVSKWSYGYSRHSMPWSPPLFEGRILSNMAERGDIVVFKRPNNDGQGYTDYIKRIIGLPGDTVQMIANRLYINGEVVPDVVVEAAQVRGAFEGQTPIQLRETLPGGHVFRIQDFGPGSPSDDTDAFTVPAGHYFVMGDNRDDSMDSRYVWEAGGVGLVPHENLVGKAQIILFSWTPGASLGNPVSWFTNVRTERFFTDLE
ncbi:MAG: signal peptidase I [Caulobacterales bacterium]|nr:signal peptidase I [Caulobacterales bacterium]